MLITKLYTWIDIRDSIEFYYEKSENKGKLDNINFRTYWDGLKISYAEPKQLSEIQAELVEIFLSRLESIEEELFIVLEGERKFPISMEKVDLADISKLGFKPSLNRSSYIGSKDSRNFSKRDASDKPILFAFHSFKGGVGRTLHSLSLALNLSENSKVLLIDADFEAPGISWLVNTPVSFADYLAMLHGGDEYEETNKIVAENLKSEIKENDNLFILPAFRSLKFNTPNLEIKPEHIYRFNDNPFVLTDVLIDLAKQLSIDYIIIDLRAGASELSSNWFFDPRINKVFVTTLSSQSILGTSMMFKILSKFENQNNLRTPETPIPSLIISQVPKSSIQEIESNWGDTYSSGGSLTPLRRSYLESFINIADYNNLEDFKELTDEQIIGRVLGPLTLFSEEYDSLKSLPDSWDEVVKLIKISELDKKLVKISEVFPIENTEITIENDLVVLRENLRNASNKLIFAETEQQDDFLKTQSIKNLANEFHNLLPIAVVVGAKGSGKTFLFKQIGYLKNWQEFGKKIFASFNNNAIVLPITQPANLSNVEDFNNIPKELIDVTKATIVKNIWLEYIKPNIEISLKDDLTNSQWRENWLDYIAWASGYKVGEKNVGREFLLFLKETKTKIVSIFDGMEDLFKQFNSNINQQTALESLLQDVPTWLESQSERYLGIIVFVRRDIITVAISQNSRQFLKKYENFELKWNAEEALRLVHWILNKFVLSVPTYSDWQNSLGDKNEAELVKTLYSLWGMRMGKNTSKEAYSHNWILGSLANLKKEIQSRDIVRFLFSAAEKTLLTPDVKITNLYKDRLLFPAAIRESIDEVGQSKIEEVKIENEPLKEVLEILENEIQNIKFPCKPEEIKNLFDDDKGIRVLEENGVLVLHSGEYYMAELYRRGMGFDYSRRGKPKVLYF